MPDAIPYVTSYYAERWGFCLAPRRAHPPEAGHLPGAHRQRAGAGLADLRRPGHPRGVGGGGAPVDLRLPPLDGEQRALGARRDHLPRPLADVGAAALHVPGRDRARDDRLGRLPRPPPEHLRRNVVAGYVVTCVGDDRVYSYLPSRRGGTLADRAALNVLRHAHPGFIRYSFLDRGSDERQYCSPGADLPVCSVMRSKYREYPEYHTSLDDTRLVTPAGLPGRVRGPPRHPRPSSRATGATAPRPWASRSSASAASTPSSA